MTDEGISNVLAQALFTSDDSEQNITDALFKIAYQLKNLGLADAGTQMGAIEVLAKEIKDGSLLIAEALDGIALCIQNSQSE